MLMPIVSMNKMAMNESVAATCCFREVATPTAVYWEVLHGGWIGSGYANDWIKNPVYKDIHGSWKNLAYDVQVTAASDVYLLEDNRVAYDGDATEKGWYVYNKASGQNVGSLESFLVGSGRLVRGSACDHKNGDCIYGDYSIQYVTNYHFESTSAHSTASDWKVPHSAGDGQFAS